MRRKPPRARLTTESREESIKQAAIACIRQFGVRKTSVEDIARLAGVNRRTFYRFFEDRHAIFEALLLDRVKEISTVVAQTVANADNFTGRLLQGAMETLRQVRKDEIFSAFAEAEYTVLFDLKEAGTRSRMELFKHVWADTFEQARATGAMRRDITTQQAFEWLLTMLHMLFLRNDLTDPQRSNILRTFVLPSLTGNLGESCNSRPSAAAEADSPEPLNSGKPHRPSR